ncbi:MAG TPA: FKBP-type peptidyl-prolyl cis-trans isomerase [Mucilaginibacter sp.]|nr:FKBP-type peptidyl-prolyl cis-trans isomerase [Mucilaginibacter sp.]
MKKIALIAAAFAVFALQASAQQDGFAPSPKGALVKNITNNAGPKIKLNDVITFNVIQKTEKDSILFDTYKAGQPIKIQVQPSQNIADLMDVFPFLAAKDSAVIKIPSDSIFKGHETERPPFLPKGSMIVVNLKIERVQSLDDAMAERNKAVDSLNMVEKGEIDGYIAKNKLLVKTTADGLRYRITQPSVKRKPLAGDTVLVNYTGRLLNGKVFDSSIQSVAQQAGLNQPGRTYEPITLELGITPVIKGWNEGLLLLNEGSKVQLIIPSSLGYGENGAGDDIPPFSPLIFDVELVKIKPVKHAEAAKPTAKKPVAKKHTTAKKKS